MNDTNNINNNIDKSLIEIHNIAEPIPFNIITPDEHFGVLTIKMAKTDITKKPLFILFTIDKTGSMNQSGGKKNYTKLDYVKQTFKNMVNYLATLDVNVYIRVHSFNESVDVIIDTILVSPNALTELIQQIEKLEADGLTDIENALKTANVALDEYAYANPAHQMVHIFMTDGEPTAGNGDVNYLYACVNDKYNNIFVGYGLDHNAQILCKLSEHENAEYQFVDNMENTAMVYGETMHRFLYPAITNAEIQMVYGLIYDWKTDEWTDCIRESVLVGEIEKIYQIKTKMPNEVEVYISGIVCSRGRDVAASEVADPEERMVGTSVKYSNNEVERQTQPILLDTVDVLPNLVDEDGNIVCPTDLTKFIFRQRTQELLFDARTSRENTNDEYIAFKQNLQDIFRRMRRYMRMNNMEEDGIMKMLCDDICITYKTFGTKHGQMYSAARANSQGRQQTYNTGAYIDSDDEDNSVDDNSQRYQTPSRKLPMPPPLQLPFDLTTDQMDHSSTIFGEVMFNGGLRQITNLERSGDEVICERLNSVDGSRRSLSNDSECNTSANIETNEIEPDIEESNMAALRRNSRSFQMDNVDLVNVQDNTFLPADELMNYIQTDTYTTCYATPSTLRTMQQMNQTPSTSFD